MRPDQRFKKLTEEEQKRVWKTVRELIEQGTVKPVDENGNPCNIIIAETDTEDTAQHKPQTQSAIPTEKITRHGDFGANTSKQGGNSTNDR